LKAKLLLLPILLSVFTVLSAQREWGEVNPKQFDTRVCAIDSTANAMILADEELINFVFEEDRIFAYYKRHKRIQILNKEGYEYANVKIYTGANESIQSIKAQTLNRGVDGKVTTTAVNKKLIFNEAISRRVSATKIAFPDIQAGSIIEFEYVTRVTSLRFLKDWYFQSTLPTLYSNVTLRSPFFFQYASVLKSSRDLSATNNAEATEKWFTLLFGNSRYAEERTDVKCYESSYTMENVPALHQEGFVNCFQDYFSRMEFILTTARLPNRNEQTFAENWEDVIAELTKSNDFGLLLGGNGVHVKDAKTMTASLTSKEEKLKLIYNYVSSKMRWNEILTVFPKGGLAKSYTEGIGNSADINMILIDMLRASGIKADPVFIKTSDNGVVQKEFPELGQFNHVIAVAEIDSAKFFLDATNPNLPHYLVDIQDLNEYGLRMNEKKAEWLSIRPSANSFSNIVAKVTLSPDGKIVSKTMLTLNDYEAVALRTKLKLKKSEDALNDLLTIDENVELLNTEIDNKDDNYKKTKTTFDVSSKKTFSGDKQIYLNPFPVKFRKENPFKLNERSYPIDFPYPFKESIKLTIEIPEGYAATDVPKSKEVRIEDGSASFLFVVEKNEKYIQINSILSVKQQQYHPGSYESIKNIFANAIDTYNSVIVLEKK
jgi:hypothetical protein